MNSNASHSLRDHARLIWQAGVRAVDPQRLVAAQVHRDGDEICVGPFDLSLHGSSRLCVVGAGKAGAAMAKGFESAVLTAGFPARRLEGWINVPEGTLPKLQAIHLHAARPAGRNEPTEAAREGAEQILRRVALLQPDDLCVALISGGGSALLPAPIDGITLADKLAVTRHLSHMGADIVALNTVRRALSRIKGGGLARACRAQRLLVLVISDVLGDPLDMIASGPCCIDTRPREPAIDIVRRFDPDQKLPRSIYRALAEPTLSSNTRTQTQLPEIHHEMIGSNAIAVDAAGEEADRLGWRPAMTVARRDEGSAEELGKHFARMAMHMLRESGPDCLISGGEPTVTLPRDRIPGKGGRNQQVALAMLEALTQTDIRAEEWSRIVFLSAGTDGEDGPTDAAGGWVDQTLRHALIQGNGTHWNRR